MNYFQHFLRERKWHILLFPGLVKKKCRTWLIQTLSPSNKVETFSISLFLFCHPYLCSFSFILSVCVSILFSRLPYTVCLLSLFQCKSQCLTFDVLLSIYLNNSFVIISFRFISIFVALPSNYYYSVGEIDFDFPQNDFIEMLTIRRISNKTEVWITNSVSHSLVKFIFKSFKN